MIRRSLLRSSRAISSNTRLSPRASSIPQPLYSSHFGRQPIAASRLRWHSEAAAQKEKPAEAPAETSQKPASEDQAPSVEETLKKDVEAKNKEIIDLKDKYLRSVADFRNLQERTKREVQAAKDFALQRFAKDLIDAVDNLDRALTTIPSENLSAADVNQDLKTLYDGLKMTDTVVMQTLKRHGLERFDPSEKAEKFDPNLHEATFMTPQPDKEDGTVFHTQQKGWSLNGRVLRAPKVGVVKNS